MMKSTEFSRKELGNGWSVDNMVRYDRRGRVDVRRLLGEGEIGDQLLNVADDGSTSEYDEVTEMMRKEAVTDWRFSFVSRYSEEFDIGV
jgi:hypothetical protein